MSIQFTKSYTRIVNIWDRMRLFYEGGITKKPLFYDLYKMYDPNAYTGKGLGRHSDRRYLPDGKTIEKFYKRFPEIQYFPMPSTFNMEPDGRLEIVHPIAQFAKQQRQLVEKGYDEDKAFEIVAEKMGSFLQKQKDETRVLRGLAYSTAAESYLSKYQKVAELESRLKAKRIERDLPKYIRE